MTIRAGKRDGQGSLGSPAVASGHPDVHHQHVKDHLLDGTERGFAVGRGPDAIAVILEDRDQGVTHADLIVDHQHRGCLELGGPVHWDTLTIAATTGSVSVNEVPAPGLLCTAIVPP